MSDPLYTWREKKHFLELELAISSDANQKFTLRKQIQECEDEIKRLQNQTNSQASFQPDSKTNSQVQFIQAHSLNHQANFDNQISNNSAPHLPAQTQQPHQPHPASQPQQIHQAPQPQQIHQAQLQPEQAQVSIPTINFNNPTIIKSVNEVWGIDITYIKLRTGWMYLVAILDLYSRYVVSWELEQTLEIDFVLSALDKTLKKAKPEIINSDQGSHFTSPQYIDRLKAASIKISMDGKGRALDNVFVKKLWRSVKYEEVYLNDYLSPRKARVSLNLYLQFYNFQRPHQSLNYLTPAHVYFHFT